MTATEEPEIAENEHVIAETLEKVELQESEGEDSAVETVGDSEMGESIGETTKSTDAEDSLKGDEIDQESEENKTESIEDTNKTNEVRLKPRIHAPAEKPLCDVCSLGEVLSTDCEDCFTKISDPTTSIAQIFAAMREWLPGSQRRIDLLVEAALERGAHVDDVDGLEGNTMLHYACKSASEGVGSVAVARKVVQLLLSKGANFTLRSRWTDMLPLHHAAYFNCVEILELLLDASKNTGQWRALNMQFSCISFFSHSLPHSMICPLTLSLHYSFSLCVTRK